MDDHNLTSFGEHGINVEDHDPDACRQFAQHLREIADQLSRGQFDPWLMLGNDGDAESADTSPTAAVLAKCTRTDGDPLYAADPTLVLEFADDYDAAADALEEAE